MGNSQNHHSPGAVDDLMYQYFSVLAKFFHIGRGCHPYDMDWFGHTDTI